MSRHLHLTGLAVVITVFAGVMSTGEPTPDRPPGIAYLRARLVADLHAGDKGADGATAGDPGRIAFDSAPSRVVPDLMFLGAREPSRNATAYAVIGVRGAMSRVLHDPADLAWIVGDWRPATSRDAIALCAETIALASDARDAVSAPFAWGIGSDSIPAAVTGRAAIADVVTPPVARRANGDAWRVGLWSIEAGRTRLYDCRLGAGADRLGIGLSVVDSLSGAGFVTGS